jgi:hypothetical protein
MNSVDGRFAAKLLWFSGLAIVAFACGLSQGQAMELEPMPDMTLEMAHIDVEELCQAQCRDLSDQDVVRSLRRLMAEFHVRGRK